MCDEGRKQMRQAGDSKTILLQRSSRKEKRHGYERRQNAQKEKGQMGDRVTAYV